MKNFACCKFFKDFFLKLQCFSRHFFARCKFFHDFSKKYMANNNLFILMKVQKMQIFIVKKLLN